MKLRALVRGGGDLATGVAARLFRIGCLVVVTELEWPLFVRGSVSFGEAVYNRSIVVEGITAKRVGNKDEILTEWENQNIPVLVDAKLDIVHDLYVDVIVDARMTKTVPEYDIHQETIVVGIGPGFIPGKNCHAVIESKRGLSLGRVLWDNPAEQDTGIPEAVAAHQEDRVLRAPKSGFFKSMEEIGSLVKKDQIIGRVGFADVTSPFDGVLRGLIHDGVDVKEGMKIGDIYPGNDKTICNFISDKALSVGGGVVEAVLSYPDLRRKIA
jgi:xanthine dehydrogenase accessory factor